MHISVGIGEMGVANRAEDSVITHALGSCLGVTAFDPVTHVGGMLHAMLPQGSLNPEKAAKVPCMFVDTGLPHLLDACLRSGAAKSRLIMTVAGGAAMQGILGGGQDFFEIGKRNIVMLRRVLWTHGLMLKASDVGGSVARTLSLELATGEVVTRTGSVSSVLFSNKKGADPETERRYVDEP